MLIIILLSIPAIPTTSIDVSDVMAFLLPVGHNAAHSKANLVNWIDGKVSQFGGPNCFVRDPLVTGAKIDGPAQGAVPIFGSQSTKLWGMVLPVQHSAGKLISVVEGGKGAITMTCKHVGPWVG